MVMERRLLSASRVTVGHALGTRSSSGSGGLVTIRGLASRTNTPYPIADFTETVARGAFRATLAARPDVQLLAQHEGLPMARTTIAAGKPGNLVLAETSDGLTFVALCDPADPDVATLVRKINAGLMREASFAFRVTGQTWSPDGSQRTITAVDLDRGDVSVCAFGANAATPVSVDSRAGRSVIRGGMSLDVAKAIAFTHAVRYGPAQKRKGA